MPHGIAIAPPTAFHTDNGSTYQRSILRQTHDALRLKQMESSCLADLCRKQMRDIKNKDATIALLQKRLLQVTHITTRRAA